MNHAHFLGRLTKDNDLKQSQGGKSVLNNSIAINRPFKNKDGERDADFINFVAFGKTAEIIEQYHNKGDMIGLSGRIQSRSYTNNNDQRIFVTELVVNEMHFAGSNQGTQQQNTNIRTNTQGQQKQSTQSGYDVSEGNPYKSNDAPDISQDELPF